MTQKKVQNWMSPCFLEFQAFQCSKLTFGSGLQDRRIKIYGSISIITLITFLFLFWMYAICVWNCNQINATIVFIYPYIAAKTSVLQYVLHWPYLLTGCLFRNLYSFWSSGSRVHTKNCNHFSRTFQGLFKDHISIFKDHLLVI